MQLLIGCPISLTSLLLCAWDASLLQTFISPSVEVSFLAGKHVGQRILAEPNYEPSSLLLVGGLLHVGRVDFWRLSWLDCVWVTLTSPMVFLCRGRILHPVHSARPAALFPSFISLWAVTPSPPFAVSFSLMCSTYLSSID